MISDKEKLAACEKALIRRQRTYFASMLLIGMVLAFFWMTIWNRQAQIRTLEGKLGTAQADLAEMRGDLQDMQGENNYFRMYSFQVVMGVLIKKARQHGVPITTALALMQIESYFNPFVISSTGDWGLYQINEWAHKFDKQIIFDPDTNIDMGLRYLKKCYDQAGSWALACAIYNAGKNYERSDHPRKYYESIFIEAK